MNYIEYIKKIKGVNDNRHHKISNSYGVYDYYKFYRKNKPKDKEFILTEKLYYTLIRRINTLVGEAILNGHEIKLPLLFGKLELRRYKLEPRVVDGKVIYNAPINWDATLRLWYEDEEARENKLLVKVESGDNFRFLYTKHKAKYNNKSFYDFNINRSLKKSVYNAAKEGKIDGYKM